MYKVFLLWNVCIHLPHYKVSLIRRLIAVNSTKFKGLYLFSRRDVKSSKFYEIWGSYGSEYKTAEPSRNIQTLQRNRLSNHQDGWVKSPTLMMETESSSVTSEHFYWHVNRYVPECVNSYPYSGPGMKDIKHQSALQNSTTLHTPVAQRKREILPHSLPFEGLMRGICSRGNVT